MHETRYDWLNDRWVIFAPNREERPNEFKRYEKPQPAPNTVCPFCCGSEHETPDPTLVLPEHDSDHTSTNRKVDPAKSIGNSWKVRVVPNKFPAIIRSSMGFEANFSSELRDRGIFPRHSVSGINGVKPQHQMQTVGADHLFQKHVAKGAHEVIIEAPTHVDSITALPADHIALIFQAYQQRLNHWRAQSDLTYAVVFKNYGADAGASLYHSHSQLISLDFVPRDVERLNERMDSYYKQFGCCYICQLFEEEEERQERVFYTSEHFIAVCPFASRFPYSFSIVPRTHRSCYEEITETELEDLAIVAKATLTALEATCPSAAYNLVLQTSPFRGGHEESQHWRLRVIPRLCKVAGFEWGSDCFINTVTPEQAASSLRKHMD